MNKILFSLSLLVICQPIIAREPKPAAHKNQPSDFQELFNEIDVAPEYSPVAPNQSPKKENIVHDMISRYDKNEINEDQLAICIRQGALCGNELDIRDPKSGKALIHLAAEKGNSRLVGLIIESGGNVALRTHTNETAEDIIKRRMVAVTTYNADDKRQFKQYSSCLNSYEKSNKRIVAQNKKIAKQRKKELLSAIDL